MKFIEDTDTINKTTEFFDKSIILDDTGAIGNDFKEVVEKIATVGIHFKIQLIYIAHHATDIAPKVRNNFHKLYVTVNNSIAFFENVKKHFQIKCKLENLRKSGFGIIQYFPISENYNLNDSNFRRTSTAEKFCDVLKKDIDEALKHKNYFF